MYRRAPASRGPGNGVDKTMSDAASSSIGDLATAIPHHRPLFRFTLALRAASLFASIGVFITAATVLPVVDYDPDSIFGLLALGLPLGVACFLWTAMDLVLILLRSKVARGWPGYRKPQRGLGSNFRWGAPAVHVAAHLVLWIAGIILSALFWEGWLSQVFVKAQEERAAMDPGQNMDNGAPVGDVPINDMPPQQNVTADGVVLDKFGFPIATDQVINTMWIMPFLQAILV